MIPTFPPEFSLKPTPFLLNARHDIDIDFNQSDHGIKAAIDQSDQSGFLQFSGESEKRQRQ